MERARNEAGFTLVETAVVVGIVALTIGALGVRALAGPSVAVAAAATGVVAAFEEARRTAIAFDAATVVFAIPAGGHGFRVRVYRQNPGDPSFAPANGPTYDGDATAEETAAPLGTPGFAFSVDGRGRIAAFAHYAATATTFDRHACPAAGAYQIALRSGPQLRTIAIPCSAALAGSAPIAFETAPPAATPPPLPSPAIACAAPGPCPLPPLPGANAAYALTVNPATITVPANAPFAFTAVDVSSSGPPGNVAIAGVQGGCDSWSVVAGTWAPSGTSFTGIGRSGTCSITVSDAAGNSATVAVTVTGVPHAQVADQCNVAYGTLVYTDPATAPPTDHLGSGQPCAATPAPVPSLVPIVEADALVAFDCSNDRATCMQVDAATEYLFADGSAAPTAGNAQQSAFSAAVAAHRCSNPAPATGGQFAAGVAYPDDAYERLYQESSDNGISGYVAVIVTACPP
jgi:type II secretory pathway pseudopilin PulG